MQIGYSSPCCNPLTLVDDIWNDWIVLSSIFQRTLLGTISLDSSYWLYLAHLPLVLILRDMMENWEVPAAIKFLLITVMHCDSVNQLPAFGTEYLLVCCNGKRYPPRKQQIAASRS